MSELQRTLEAIHDELEHLRSGPDRAPSRLGELLSDNLIDLADHIHEFDEEEKTLILGALDSEQKADFIEEMEVKEQRFFLGLLHDRDELAAVVSEMKADDLADLIEEHRDEVRSQVLDVLSEERAETIRELVTYAADTAGGLMTTEFLAVPEGSTVLEVKEKIRADDAIESVSNIYVTAGERLLGVFSVRQLLLADNAEPVSEFMVRDVKSIDVDDDAEECYRVMETYHLSTIPVVDEYHDLLGIVTFDDVLTVGEMEASEDVFKMAGSGDLNPTRDSVFGRVTKRLPWLIVSIFGGFGTAWVIGLFGRGEAEVIGEVARFLPMIVMLGGNIATQSSATMVRGFATGEIEINRMGRVIFSELLVGTLVGAICATIGGALAYVGGQDDPLGMFSVVLASIIALSFIAASLGTTVPAVCARLDFDPAYAAGPFITTMVDMIGAAVYLTFVLTFRVPS